MSFPSDTINQACDNAGSDKIGDGKSRFKMKGLWTEVYILADPVDHVIDDNYSRGRVTDPL